MPKKWKITAIGPTEISKTTSLVELYRQVNYYSPLNEFIKFKLKFEYNSSLSEWVRVLDNGGRLNPTSRTRSYDLTLKLNDKPVTDIEWVDTVGGSIYPNNSYYRDTKYHVSTSDKVIVFLSCPDLLPSDSSKIVNIKSAVENTLNLLSYTRRDAEIVVCLSKCDLVDEFDMDYIQGLIEPGVSSLGRMNKGVFTSNMSENSYMTPAAPVMSMFYDCMLEDLDEIGRIHVLQRHKNKVARNEVADWLHIRQHSLMGVWTWDNMYLY